MVAAESYLGFGPDTLPEASEGRQAQTDAGTIGSPTGLYDFHIGRDINVLVGCGLGVSGRGSGSRRGGGSCVRI